MNFKNYFLKSKDLAERRVILARERDYDFEKLYSWMDEYDSLLEENSHVRGAIATTLGYAFGNYTTFCMTQKELDIFDEEIRILREGFF